MHLHRKRIKILCVTSGRSDLFIWLPVWRAIMLNPKFELCIAKTGMHFVADKMQCLDEFTNVRIFDVGFDLGGNTKALASEAMAASAGEFGILFAKEKPDVIFVLGDRMDMFPAVFASLPFNIRCIHLHGGEISLGAIDDRIRHAVSMMSSVHFVAHSKAKDVIVGFGKDEKTVHVVGAPGLDNIKNIPIYLKNTLLYELGVPERKDYFVGTVHSETNSIDPVKPLLETIKAVKRFDCCEVIFTHSNSDPCNSVISNILLEASYDISHFHFFPNLRYEQYVNLMRHAVAVIGNSSSGLIEAPFLSKRVLNIGDRQKGRVADVHVLHSQNDAANIFSDLELLFSIRHDKTLTQSSLYGSGTASADIMKILDTIL